MLFVGRQKRPPYARPAHTIESKYAKTTHHLMAFRHDEEMEEEEEEEPRPRPRISKCMRMEKRFNQCRRHSAKATMVAAATSAAPAAAAAERRWRQRQTISINNIDGSMVRVWYGTCDFS